MSRADANVSVGADGTAFFKAVKSIQAATDTMANSITARLARLNGAFGAVSSCVGAVSSSITAMGDLMGKVINPAAGAEQLQLSFQVLLDGEEKALDFMQQLNTYAAQTPYSIDSISNAAKTLLAMTDLTGEQAIAVIRKLGDVCAMSGKDLNEMAQVYAKAANSGVDNIVAKSFENAGLPIRKLVAEIQGISFEEVKTKIGDGVVTLEHLDAALDAATGAGGKLNGATLQLSTTYNGLASTLADNVNQALTKMGAEILPAIKPAMEKLIEAVQAAFPVFENLGDLVGTWLGDKVQGDVIPALEDFMLFLPEVGDELEIMGRKVMEFVDTLMAIPNAISSVQDWIGDLTSTISIWMAQEERTWDEAKKLQREFKADNDPDEQVRRRSAARRAEFDEMMEQSKKRADRRRADARAADEARAAEREAAAETKRAEDEKRKAVMATAEAQAKAAKEAQERAKKEQEAREKVIEEEEKYQRALNARKLEKKGLDAQQQGMEDAARALGVLGKVSINSLTERIGELNTEGGHEKEIKLLQELRDQWEKLIDKKKEYRETRTAEAAEMQAKVMELSGDTRGANKAREEETIRKRIIELTAQGMDKANAKSQAILESKMRLLERMQKAGGQVLSVQGSRTNVGGGQGIRIDYQLAAVKQSNTLLQDIKQILSTKLTAATGKGSTAPVLA